MPSESAHAPDHASVDRGIAGPTIRDHDQLGELREYTSPWGRIEVSSRGNVVRMVSTLEPQGPGRVAIDRAGEIAAEFMNRVIEDATDRNFEVEAAGDGGGVFEFRWVERPRPGQHAIFPNDVTVRLFPQTGQLASFFATDVRAYRTTAPHVSETDLPSVLHGLLEGRAHRIVRTALLEDPISGGMDTRTVYRIAVATRDDKRVTNMVVDADSGACIVPPR